MPGNPVTVVAPPHSGWTVETYAIHNEAIRSAEAKFSEERDRRYAEVATEREKALKIKETADLAALGLAREIQTYKDEKANELRAQLSDEREEYASKTDLKASVERIEEILRPLIAFVSASQGQSLAQDRSQRRSEWTFERVLTAIAIIASAIYFIYNTTRAV